MKRLSFAVLAAVALATTQGCNCGGTNPSDDAGTGGGSGGGAVTGGGAGGGSGGGATGGGGGVGGGTGTGGGTGGAGGGTARAVGPAKDVVSGAGRLSGGNFVMNAQIGQGTPQAPATGGGRVLQGNTAIKH